MDTILSLSDHTDLGTKVYELLRSQIITANLAPGSRLQVVNLASRLGVSRSPVTDALNRLCGEGLVEEIPRKGFFVSHLSTEDLIEVFDARTVIELTAAERAVDAISPGEIGELRKLIAMMAQCVDGEGNHLDYPKWLQLDSDFHRIIVGKLKNRRLIEFYERLNSHGYMIRFYFHSSLQQRASSDTLQEHGKIVDSVESRDLPALKAAIAHHIQTATDFFAKCNIGDPVMKET